MEPSVIAFKLPKSGNAPDECEDALGFSLEQLRFALADGATESSFADRWAKSLVHQYILDPPFGLPPSEDAMQLWLLPQQEEWRSGIDWTALPWYAQEKAEVGAFSTLLGLEFGSGESLMEKIFSHALGKDDLKWHAMAVGDTCLFHIRDDALRCAFPLTHADQFNSRPILLASNPSDNTSALKDIRSLGGSCRAGDLFMLATDALAKWFLAQCEADQKPWQILLELRSEADFAALVASARHNQSLRNDDTTLVILNWGR